ncbi:MAG: UDP-N-acetylmuramoyl-L-alanyl-D-glutamate--2,6-diaminopimelate ligase [Parachlamydiaceae bacterium]
MKLKQLIKDIPFKQIKGAKDLVITGICSNSKLVSPGNLFIARRGRADDGMTYIPEAVAAGAIAVFTDIFDPLIDKSVTQIIHPDVAALEGVIAANYYQFASNEMFMVGITGTNGKTTTSFLVKHLLDNLVGLCGLIGTIKYVIGEHHYDAVRTTPDAVSNQKMLREMVLQHCQSAVMEVTSHALDQHRVDCINFDTAVFTNLTLDHLDYHMTMEHYSQSKNRLFRSLDPSKKKKIHPYPKVAVVNIDNAWYKKMIEGCRAEIITYGMSPEADLKAENVLLTPAGASFVINFRGHQVPFTWALSGRFNVYNCLAAVAVGLSRRLPLEAIAKVLETAPAIPGRLQAIPNPLGLKIYIDFAHSDDALLNVLECLQEFKTGRLITVFGCGGNRDTGKRPKMARVCEKHSDISIVTSDNPRNESPMEIIRQIITGFSNDKCYIIELDRRKAIEKAIDLATPEDIILIAGKGHEPYQIFAHQTIEFDDKKVALQICQERSQTHLWHNNS